ncbi:MAG: primosomal protein N', partial [Leptospirillia bacterium]
DGAYKQEETPRYHGRDVAIMRAQEAGVPVVLGSATPSMESFSKARRGDYLYLQLPDRVESRPLPGVELVDLREHRSVLPGGVVTEPLQKALAETLERGEQALLFVNRRGYAPMLLCPDCGHTWTCHHCQVSLTFHQKDRSIRCHYCDDRRLVPESCPDCGNIDLKPVGIGTQKLMQEVAQLFPQASLLRMDRDTTRAKNAHLDILKQVTDGHADVLIGTQMVAKGHNLPGVTLVGVVCADQGIHVPDFRAAEGVFSLLTQVAGRAGRGDRPGRVVLQTFDPEHPAIRCAVTHDYAGFAEVELAMRGAVGFPPAGRATRLLLRDRSPDRIEQAARVIAERVRHLPENGVTVLGPAPPLIAMLRDEHRLHLLIKGERAGPVRQVTRWLVDEIHKTPGLASVRLDIDVDPQNLM